MRRFLRRCGRLPLFRLGVLLLLLSQLMDGIDALLGLDLAALLPQSWNVAQVTAALGVVKIAIRGIIVVASSFQPRDGPQ